VVLQQDLIDIDPEDLMKLHRPLPRYTSYPTALEYAPIEEDLYIEKLKAWNEKRKPLSLYVHIPFCKSMCLFCACSVVLNRQGERQRKYIDALLKEIDLLASHLTTPLVNQLHFGGGTPTNLTQEEFLLIFEKLYSLFNLDSNGEISIEIDPRSITFDKLRFLKQIGFNRVSFGVQDTDPKVQEAVRRRQSAEMSRRAFEWARELGFSGINLDLIYGLPLQTPESFNQTVDEILAMGPDRIALFSYARVPHLKLHQKAIRDEDLPSTRQKFEIYVLARKRFMNAGYVAIGMDHFAKKEDPIAQAYFDRKLYRNFQGYSLKLAEDMIGLGLSSIGSLQGDYFQNQKGLEAYQNQISEGKLSVSYGKILNTDDHIRYWVIQRLTCDFRLQKKEFVEQFGLDFDSYFSAEQNALEQLRDLDLVQFDEKMIEATQKGRLFIRNIASVFDAYLKSKNPSTFSKSI